MKALISFLAVLALGAPLSSCAPSFDTPPDLQPLLQAYENPTAVVTSEIMAEVADEIAKAAEEIQDSEIFEEILQVIIDVQQELDAAAVKTCEDGTNKGNDCVDDTDCPDSACVSNGDIVLGQTCEDGANKGNECVADKDCRPGVCDGGTDEGSDCDADTDCPGGGTCAHPGVCDGGTSEGSVCAADTDCAGGGTCGFGTCGGGVVDPKSLRGKSRSTTSAQAGTKGNSIPIGSRLVMVEPMMAAPALTTTTVSGGTCVEAAPPADENGTINLTMTLDGPEGSAALSGAPPTTVGTWCPPTERIFRLRTTEVLRSTWATRCRPVRTSQS